MRSILQTPPPHACPDRATRISALLAYSVAHFCVDLACAMLVMGLVVPALVGTDASDTEMVAFASLSILLYNLVAFAFQLPIGMLADHYDDNAMVSAWGCAVVILAYTLVPVSPMVAATVAGLGNAMFHIGGGIDVLNLSGTRRADMSGVFVSTGAMGLFLGLNWSDVGLSLPEVPLILLTASGMAIVAMRHLVRQNGTLIANEELRPEFSGMPLPVVLVLIGMSVTIVIRSYLGFSVAFPWKTGVALGTVNTLVIVLGKMLGGIIGDRLGWKRTAILSLPLASVLFLVSYDHMWAGLAAMLLFNMTMPLTLTTLADTFRHNKGAAFGITTVALFVGGRSTSIPFLSSPVGIALMCLVSFATIMVGFRGYDGVLTELMFDGDRWRRIGDGTNDKVTDKETTDRADAESPATDHVTDHVTDGMTDGTTDNLTDKMSEQGDGQDASEGGDGR